MAGKTSLLSNVKVQGQKLFKTTKELMLEDKLISKSVDDAASKVAGKSSAKYKGFMDNLNNADGLPPEIADGLPESIANTKATREAAEKLKPKDMSILGGKINSETAGKIHSANADNLAVNGIGAKYGDLNGAYDKLLKKTKGSVMMNTPGSIMNNYYGNPLREGIKAGKGGTAFKDNKALQKATARIGTTAAVAGTGIGAGVSAVSHNRDRRQY